MHLFEVFLELIEFNAQLFAFFPNLGDFLLGFAKCFEVVLVQELLKLLLIRHS